MGRKQEQKELLGQEKGEAYQTEVVKMFPSIAHGEELL
jgi:hypothetical protein